EAVILVTGRLPGAKPGTERVEWSMGEALVNVNYRVSGKQAAYVYAMAEKRGKDRVILKLIELHGLVYSEEEADEFRAHQPAVRAVDADFEEPPAFDEVTEAEGDLKRRIDEAESINAVTDLMLDGATQAVLATMPAGTRDEVRDYAKARLVALGWPKRSGRRSAA
ncbi:MAG: trna delta -isopentenylpyrophosphate transferase, partial [Actinomycetospora chiangmaiensis]|nr:trna delta -isopentenylpyrophosphate transferase [Actinomycetospora chiangmaiensis]